MITCNNILMRFCQDFHRTIGGQFQSHEIVPRQMMNSPRGQNIHWDTFARTMAMYSGTPVVRFQRVFICAHRRRRRHWISISSAVHYSAPDRNMRRLKARYCPRVQYTCLHNLRRKVCPMRIRFSTNFLRMEWIIACNSQCHNSFHSQKI